MSPLKSTLTQRGRSFLRKSTIALRPKPLTRKPPPEVPPFELLGMSSYELKVFYFLKKRAISFTPQVNFAGGVSVLGGMRVDFLLPDYNLIIRVQGPWHTFAHAKARDELQRTYLLGRGLEILDLWEDDIENLDSVLAAKLGIPVRGGRA